MSNMKPEIRFGEFADAWEKRKLGSITESFSGGTPSSGNSEYYGGSIPFIRSGEISLNITELFVTEAGLNNSSAKMVKEGDILYALYGATSGEVSISKINGAINQAILAIRSINNDDHYLIAQWLRMQKKRIISTYLQGGQGNLSGSIVKELEITLPINKDEQKLISSLFYTLDNIITLHQRKLNKIKNFKSAYLSKMFPKEGERYPRLRFAGFTDAWEQRKLGELCDIFTDGDWIESKDQSDSGIRLVQTGNIGITEYLDKPNNMKWISQETFERLRCKEVLPGDLLISRLPEPAGRACIMPSLGTKMITAVDCTIVRTTPDYSNNFLVQFLSTQNYFNKVNAVLAGGTRQRISRGNLGSLDVPTPPTYEEQETIGVFLQRLDNLITLHQRELEKLKQLKQAMLQKMFV